ncbi:hypothetical protein CVT25_004114, partial [Psilocybe cyanescens]
MPPKQQPTRPPSPFQMLASRAKLSTVQLLSTAFLVPTAGTPAVQDTYSQGPVSASRRACTAQPSHSATSLRQSSCHCTPTVTARDNTTQPSDAPLPARSEDKDMDDPPTYLSLSYGDSNVVEDSQRIIGALRIIVGYVNSLHINLHSSPMGASLAQVVVDFTLETFNGDLGTTPTPNNILPIRAVVELFPAEDNTIRRPLALSHTSPDPLRISSPPAWSDHSGAVNDNIVMILAEPVLSSHRSAQARPPVRAQQDKGKGRADKPPPPSAPPQPRPLAKKPVVPNQRPPPVPPSATRPVHPAPRSYAEATCKKVQIQQPATPAAPPSRPPFRKGRRIRLLRQAPPPLLSLISGTLPLVPALTNSSTNSSCSGIISSGYVLVRRALASPSALGVGSGVIQSAAVMWSLPNACAVLVLTSWRSIALLQAAVKEIQRQTPFVEGIMVPMSTLACSGSVLYLHPYTP